MQSTVSQFILLFLCFRLFYTYGKATDQPRKNDSPNPAFILDNNLKPTSYPIEFLDALFHVYKQKKGGIQNTPFILSTEDLLKWSN